MSKRLYRSRRDRIIGGVCGGIGEYFNLDPTLVRLIFLILLFRGIGVLGYIIAMIIIPEKPLHNPATKDSNPIECELDDLQDVSEFSDENDDINVEKETVEEKKKDNNRILGIILILLGGLFLIEIWLPHIYMRQFWPAVVIILGISILVKGARNHE